MGNFIKKIPDSLNNLINLRELCLSFNQIVVIPKSIDKLQNLERLYLHNNKIKTIPRTIGNLKKLNKLYLENNLITSIPNTLYKLTNLEMHLENNKLIYISKKILKLKKVFINSKSYLNLDNMSQNIKYLHINDLDITLSNLPYSLEELRLYDPKINICTIKIPFGCLLFVNDVLINNN